MPQKCLSSLPFATTADSSLLGVRSEILALLVKHYDMFPFRLFSAQWKSNTSAPKLLVCNHTVRQDGIAVWLSETLLCVQLMAENE